MRYARLLFVTVLLAAPAGLVLAGGEGEAAAGEVPELHVISRMLGTYQEGNLVQGELEKAVGAKFNWEPKSPGEYRQTTQTILASGDYPDLLEAWFADAQREIKELAEDEVIIGLDALLAEHGPNVLKARPFEAQWYRPFGPDGDTYSINARFNSWGFEWGYTIRQDWLDNLGLSVPQDLEEYYEVVRAFTHDDPDGDGKADTYGLSGGYPAKGRRSMIEYILGGHGVLISHWDELDGDLVWWAVHPGTKEAIRYFRRLFEEGLVDPEFPIMTRPQWLDKQRQDTYGTLWWWNTHLDEGYSQWWTEFKRGVPHARVSFIPPAPDPQGRRRMPGQGVKGYSPGLIIFSHAEHPEKAIQLIDYLATDEGAALAAFGLPGVHWEEGDNRVISKIDTAEDQAAAGNYIFSWFFRRDNMMVTSPLVFENRAAYVDYVQRPIIEDRVEAEGEYRAGLGGLESSRLLRMQIEPDIDLDAEWEAYVEEWYASGGQAITDQKNAVWKAMR